MAGVDVLLPVACAPTRSGATLSATSSSSGSAASAKAIHARHERPADSIIKHNTKAASERERGRKEGKAPAPNKHESGRAMRRGGDRRCGCGRRRCKKHTNNQTTLNERTQQTRDAQQAVGRWWGAVG